MNWLRLREDLIRHEGKRNKPYADSVGKTTIGVGRNLDDVGLDDTEVNFLLDRDILRASAAVAKIVKGYDRLPEDVQEVLVNMTFNLGPAGLSKFPKMLKAIEALQFETAAAHGRDSLWYTQVGARAEELMKRLETA